MAEVKTENLYREVQKRLIATLLYDAEDVTKVLEQVSEDDFQEPAYQLIYHSIANVARHNEPVSIITVAEDLELNGELKKAGGPARLYQLRDSGSQFIQDAPVELYARIVKEASAKTKITNVLVESKDSFKLDSGVSVIDAVSELQNILNQELYKAQDDSTSSEMSEDYDGYLELLEERKRIAKENPDNDGLQGIPCLLSTLNKYTSGWRKGQMITVGARTGIGKALALDTVIPTPFGPTTMGELEVGDQVLGRDGLSTTVIGVTSVQYNRKCYRVTLHNGESLIADADHRWLVDTYMTRKHGLPERVMTTQEMVDEGVITVPNDRKNFSIKVADPIEQAQKNLPIDPYILGYWLGAGHSWSSTLAVGDQDLPNILGELDRAGLYYTVNKGAREVDENVSVVRFSKSPLIRGGDRKKTKTSTADLRHLNVLQNKHIPEIYLQGSVAQRKALLAGLLDSDGSCSSKNGRVEFAFTRKVLADDAARLASSLGLIVFRTEKNVRGKTDASSIGYNIGFKSDFNPFRLERKARRWVPRSIRSEHFYIASIEEAESVPVRCIQVDNQDHVYLAGKSMVPTHNTVFAVNCVVAAAQAGKSVQFFSLEMGDDEVKDRIVSSVSSVPMNKLRSGEDLQEDEQAKLEMVEPDLRRMKIKIETDARVTLDSIRAKALKQAQSENGLDMIVIDYLQLITPVGRFGSRQEAVADISRNVKLLAKQLEVPVMVLVQVNRESKDEESAVPRMNQIRESAAVAQDSDIVILLHRDDPTDDSIPHTLVLLEKNRQGESQKTIRCHSILECSLFREVIRSRDIEHTEVERFTDDEQEGIVAEFDDDMGDFFGEEDELL